MSDSGSDDQHPATFIGLVPLINDIIERNTPSSQQLLYEQAVQVEDPKPSSGLLTRLRSRISRTPRKCYSCCHDICIPDQQSKIDKSTGSVALPVVQAAKQAYDFAVQHYASGDQVMLVHSILRHGQGQH